MIVAALFIAIIFNDLMNEKSSEIPKHALFGLVCTGSFIVLTQNDHEAVCWALLIVPVIALTVSFVIMNIRDRNDSRYSRHSRHSNNYKNKKHSLCGSSDVERDCPAPITIVPDEPECPPPPPTVSLPESLPSSCTPDTPPYSITPSTDC